MEVVAAAVPNDPPMMPVHARAAKSYWRVQRLVQAACVQACTGRGWTIPFPHLSVVRR